MPPFCPPERPDCDAGQAVEQRLAQAHRHTQQAARQVRSKASEAAGSCPHRREGIVGQAAQLQGGDSLRCGHLMLPPWPPNRKGGCTTSSTPASATAMPRKSARDVCSFNIMGLRGEGRAASALQYYNAHMQYCVCRPLVPGSTAGRQKRSGRQCSAAGPGRAVRLSPVA